MHARIARRLGVCALAFGLSAMAVATASAQTIELKFSTINAENNVLAVAHKWWADEIEKRTDGRVTVRIFWADSLVKGVDMLVGTGQGLTDVGVSTVGYYPGQLPLSTVLELPYVTERVDAAMRAMNEAYASFEPLREEFESHNVRLLTFVPAPAGIIGTKVPVHSVDDLKGLKLRGFGVINLSLEKLGATGVAVPINELYVALQRGVVDGWSGTHAESAVALKFYEVTKYMTNPAMGNFAAVHMVVNKDVWDGLPPDIQQIVQEVTDEYISKATQDFLDNNGKLVDVLLENGVEFYHLPPEELERIRSILLPGLWDDFVAQVDAKGLPGSELFAVYRELVAKYEPDAVYEIAFPPRE